MFRSDVLVIGSEGAGARAAWEAADRGQRVVIVTKGRLARSGATLTGAADLDVDSRSLRHLLGPAPRTSGVAPHPEDSPEQFFRDMCVEGKWLNDQRLVRAHVEDVPERARELLEAGLKVYDLRQMPGHRYPRNMYTSGHDLVQVLKAQIKRRPIHVVEDTMITDLLTRDGQVVGAVGLDLVRGEPVTFAAKAVVLATGGGHNVYEYNTGPEELTGDGQAMALRAGAELLDMEMTQFLPTTIVSPPIARGNLFPFLLGPQNALRIWLLNKYGERFMGQWDPERWEHTTRDLLAIGIMNEVVEGRGTPGGGVYMSLKHLPNNLIDDFARWGAKPFISKDWKSHGLSFAHLIEDVKRGNAIEVAPACHFFMGGVRIDEWGATTLPGLFAAGEVTGGCHGANRLSGNAFAQILVQGKRAGEAAARFAAASCHVPEPDAWQVRELHARILAPLNREGPSSYEVRAELRNLMQMKVGVVRDGPALREALARIEELLREAIPRLAARNRGRVYNPEWIECLQTANLATTMAMVARGALTREESRGAHFRRDYRRTDNARWLKHIVQRLVDGRVELRLDAVETPYMQPPQE
ncbi:MAG: FAD-binding protein [Chloroflexi bacterium]|nr:FAD-binding protein [Chloroflexota bacterium]